MRGRNHPWSADRAAPARAWQVDLTSSIEAIGRKRHQRAAKRRQSKVERKQARGLGPRRGCTRGERASERTNEREGQSCGGDSDVPRAEPPCRRLQRHPAGRARLGLGGFRPQRQGRDGSFGAGTDGEEHAATATKALGRSIASLSFLPAKNIFENAQLHVPWGSLDLRRANAVRAVGPIGAKMPAEEAGCDDVTVNRGWRKGSKAVAGKCYTYYLT
jgi:hypothetical protein